jgi:hypothetical protein
MPLRSPNFAKRFVNIAYDKTVLTPFITASYKNKVFQFETVSIPNIDTLVLKEA